MKNILPLFFILICTNTFAFFNNSKIKVQCLGSNSIDLIFTYELKDKEIFETVVMPKKDTSSGKDELISLTKLEDCTVKDSRNWSCGGKTSYDTSGRFRSELHSVHEGRYKFLVGFNLGKDRDAFCVKRVQSN
jgi:hypothetical protein